MLLWTSNLHRPPPIYKTRTSRPWRLFDPATFRADLELAPFYVICSIGMEHGPCCSCIQVRLHYATTKKPDLDPSDVTSYRPISNLSVISKPLERLVCKQIMDYLKNNGLLPQLQLAYLPGHSTETAVLKVLSDVLLAVDDGNMAVLALLDLSSAFNSVDHDTLLRRLQTSYVLEGAVIGWFTSYLHGRMQKDHFSSSNSEPSVFLFCVPQGSSWGRFSSYCIPPIFCSYFDVIR